MIKRAVSLFFIFSMHWAVIAGNKTSPDPYMAMVENFQQYSDNLYEELNEPELDREALNTALKGYVKLLSEGKVEKQDFLTVIDMSRSANSERFYLINLVEMELMHKSVVSHGRNSGELYARHFSNKEGSFKSSIGFYLTAETYFGKHGLSLRLDGLESSNNNARKRAIVIHSADYATEEFINQHGRLGRSLGCPALPKKDYKEIIETIKEGTLLYVYYPERKYFENSELANFAVKNVFNHPKRCRTRGSACGLYHGSDRDRQDSAGNRAGCRAADGYHQRRFRDGVSWHGHR